MSNQSVQSILVLEDDDTFRSFVTSLLQSRGLNVVEASSVREATTKLGSMSPLLAIVDYRLPESDGITWITKLREQGKNFPIVFLSGIWCDEKTFDWLRNILRVSLILQKPLIPDLFMQQIESLLPKSVFKDEAQVLAENAITEREENAASERQSEEGGDLNKSEQVAVTKEQKPDLKQRMALLRKNYAGQLAQAWAELTEVIELVRNDSANAIEKNRAVHLAHKIRGTAGSVGFSQVGEIAGKLEDLLQGLDPEDPLRAVVWSEIMRALPAGEELVHAIIQSSKENEEGAENSDRPALHRLLFIGDKASYSQYLANLSKTFSLEVDLIDSVLSARKKLSTQKVPYDVAILDMQSVGPKNNLLALTKEIRLAQGQQSIPLSVILPENGQLTAEDLAYAGISATINRNNLEAELLGSIRQMFSAMQVEKPRILLVDDDEVLTKYLADLLINAGMTVQTLHKPIKIVSMTESFAPDLVLLDVVMPGLSGYDVCRILRATEKWQQLPVLFLTAESDQVSRAAAFQAGGSDFLCKPVISEEVLARVRTHLANSLSKKQPQRDELTGTLMSNAFINPTTDLVAKAEKEGQPVTLCLLSIENFVKLSVQHGWYPMQQVLATLGQLLKGRFKAEVLKGRLAEDTFALAFYGEHKEEVEKILALLRNEFADLKFSSDSVGHFKTIFAMGIAEYTVDGSSLKSLLGAANQRLVGSRLSSLV